VRRVYAKVWGREPKVTAIHAGLECGLIGEKVPGMDMVSFGPHLENVHSPDERIHVPSVGRFWDALKGVLEELAG
jgi:dipeptidase D